MIEIPELERIAVLIDSDNTKMAKLDAVINEISAYGRIVVKRAYGNWKKEVLKNWEPTIKELAIKAEQQFDYVSGKNATDMALVIDAMDLLHNNTYDAFVIVSSDSDYTPLAVRLHESGVYVIGVGEKKTPLSFRNSCDDFLYLENISELKEAEAAKTPASKQAEKDGFREIHNLLKIASEKWQDENGFVNIGAAGSYIKRAKPDFDSRLYGFPTLTKLVENFPKKYEVSRQKNGNKQIVRYRCKSGLFGF